MIALVLLPAEQIGDAEATLLTNALERNSTLTELFLSGKHKRVFLSFFAYGIIFLLLWFAHRSCWQTTK